MKTKTSERGGKLKKGQQPLPIPKTYLPIRITPELIERIDALRPDLIPREPFVRHVLDIGLNVLEEEG
jgi:hypothetical protein